VGCTPYEGICRTHVPLDVKTSDRTICDHMFGSNLRAHGAASPGKEEDR